MTNLKKILILLPIFTIIFLCSGCPNDYPDFKIQMLQQINDIRTKGCLCGPDTMPPAGLLIWSDLLEIAAIRHVKDMAANTNVEHFGSDGSFPYQRTLDAGFQGLIGENIGRGSITVDDIMERWINSEQHCKTIMNEKYSYFAVAYEDYCWVQMFGGD